MQDRERYIEYCSSYLPVQDHVLHSLTWTCSPEHGAPPYIAVWIMIRVAISCPPPQVAVHGNHTQSPHTQSIGIIKAVERLILWIQNQPVCIRGGGENSHHHGIFKRWAVGCVKFQPDPAWLLLNETGTPFSASLNSCATVRLLNFDICGPCGALIPGLSKRTKHFI